MAADLRAFLDEVRRARPADILEVEREVDPHHETAAILAALEERQRSPILVFPRVAGCELTLVTNVCGSMGRLALALRCGLRDVAARYGAAALAPIEPVRVAVAPVQAVVRRGTAVDLGILPRLIYHQDDAAEPYITGAIVVARDPETGVSNLSYHRLMIAGRATTGIFIEKGRHLDGIFAKYVARAQPMPIAVFIGAHPAWSLGALYAGSAAVSEYDVIGGLLGAPLEIIASVTWPELSVPAHAEIVLEGVVSHDERMREGPFGEFTGYGTGVTQTPVFHVAAITHRERPLYQDVVSGHLEHLILSMPALEHRTLRDATSVAPGVTRVALVAPLTAVVAVRKQHDGEPRRIIEQLLRGDIYSKHVIVVDDDVDPNDLRQVLAAVALQCQADRSVVILTGEQGTPLDPSCPASDGKTAKMGIDATRPLAGTRSVTRNRIPRHVADALDIDALLRKR